MKYEILPEEKLLELIKKTDAFGTNKKSQAINPPLKIKQKTASEESSRITKVFLFVFVLFAALAINMFYPLLLKDTLTQVVQTFLKQINPPETKPVIETKKPAVKPIKAETETKIINISTIADISLIGVISGSNPSAIIEDHKNGANYTVETGNTILEYTVTKIEKGKVTLTRDGREFVLTL